MQYYARTQIGTCVLTCNDYSSTSDLTSLPVYGGNRCNALRISDSSAGTQSLGSSATTCFASANASWGACDLCRDSIPNNLNILGSTDGDDDFYGKLNPGANTNLSLIHI